MKKVDAVQLITMTQTIWPNWAARLDSEDTFSLAVESWAVILDDVELDLSVAALHSLATDGREFAPQPGQIRKRAIQLRMQADGTLPPSVDEAWRIVGDAVRRYGRSSKPKYWPHDAIGSTVEAMGWNTMCESTNVEATRAHFFQLYRSVVERYEREAHTPPSVVAAAQRAALEAQGEHRELPRIGMAVD